MALTSNLYLALTGVTGAGAAVGLPLTYIYKEELGLTSSVSQAPKITQAAAFENIEKCSNNNGENIDFGAKGVEKVCGTTEESSDSTNLKLADDSKYTHLFQKMGNNQNGYGSSGNDYGKTNCDKNTQNKGTFSSQISGGESLGLCDNTQSPNQGLTVKNEGNTTIEICSGECFQSQNVSNGKTLDASKTKDKGTKITFKKQIKE